MIELKLKYPNIMPAITIVDECNKLDTGVGAAIALISHEENGRTADLVKNMMTNINSTNSTNAYEKITIYKLNTTNSKV
jgi:hypothetical protein